MCNKSLKRLKIANWYVEWIRENTETVRINQVTRNLIPIIVKIARYMVMPLTDFGKFMGIPKTSNPTLRKRRILLLEELMLFIVILRTKIKGLWTPS